MTFFSKFARTFSNTSDIFASHNCVADRGLFDGLVLFAPQSPRSAMPQGGTLTKAELQRIVADMVG